MARQEIRVYIVANAIKDGKPLDNVEVENLSDDEFIQQAEDGGNVLSLNGFLRTLEEFTYGSRTLNDWSNGTFRAYLIDTMSEDTEPVRLDIPELKENKIQVKETCPICGSTDIDYDCINEESIEAGVYYECTCNDCGATYKEWYDLEFSEQTDIEEEA